MIRTRDFMLFVGVLLLLCSGIVITVVKDTLAPKLAAVDLIISSTTESQDTFTAVAPTGSEDRDETIARLRTLLEEDTSIITSNPSVESTQAVAFEEEATSTSLVSAATVKKCSLEDDALAYSRKWPLTKTTLTIKDGRRLVIQRPEIQTVPIDVNATSTSEATFPEPELKILLSLPVAPVVTQESSCVPSEVIGVTTYGSLIFNTDVGLYRLHTSEMLIGYARDGFPIYGSYDKEVDSCGGYSHSTGYRYTVSPDRNFIIGCYKATPISFNAL